MVVLRRMLCVYPRTIAVLLYFAQMVSRPCCRCSLIHFASRDIDFAGGTVGVYRCSGRIARPDQSCQRHNHGTLSSTPSKSQNISFYHNWLSTSEALSLSLMALVGYGV